MLLSITISFFDVNTIRRNFAVDYVYSIIRFVAIGLFS